MAAWTAADAMRLNMAQSGLRGAEWPGASRARAGYPAQDIVSPALASAQSEPVVSPLFPAYAFIVIEQQLHHSKFGGQRLSWVIHERGFDFHRLRNAPGWRRTT